MISEARIPRYNSLEDFNPSHYKIETAQRWLERRYGPLWFRKLTGDQIEKINIKKTDLHFITMIGEDRVTSIWSLTPEWGPDDKLSLRKMRIFGFRAIQRATHEETSREADILNIMWRALIYRLRGDLDET